MPNVKDLIPVAVAYFVVHVPAGNDGVMLSVDARRTVEAYLYSGAEVVRVDGDTTDFDHPTYEVLVRTESYQSYHELLSRVQYQRDRLSSGWYSSSEPQFLGILASAL
jgi:hypothetical protein